MSLITINQVNCKDCYKCVRYCPVKAIRVVGGHAAVDDERCLGDGGCIHVCPQHAKQVRSDLEIVRGLLASGAPVLVSLAPAAAGVFGEKLPQLIGALKRLGITRVEETARTAAAVAHAHAELAAQGGPIIATACPAVVALVEKYYPHLVSMLAPVPSPMAAHARLLREEHGPQSAVVFIGPCVAKKGEADEAGLNAALTFDELLSWFDLEQLAWAEAPAAAFDNAPVGQAELFPLLSGMLRTAGVPDDALNPAWVSVSGLREVKALLDELPSLHGIRLIEALACSGGCLQGPGASRGPDAWTRRCHLLQHVAGDGLVVAPADMSRQLTATPLLLAQPSEEEIIAILRRTGKHGPVDEHNCGACGYDTCREKAVAVFQGMAEAEMCVPHMRTRAESFSNLVIRATPNAIVIIDSALRMLDVNPAFCKLFGHQTMELIGRPLKTVLDVSGYERVKRTGRPFGRHEATYGDVVVREMIFPVENEEIIIGMYVDVTDEVAQQRKLQDVKQETLGKARQVIEKQMRVAQEIAGLLGETTAETKVLLNRLIQLSNEEDERTAGNYGQPRNR